MSSGTAEARFSFMTAGPRLEVTLPPDVEPLPELSSPLANPNGSRSFDFLPAWEHDQIGPDYSLIDTLRDRHGRTVELYRWPLEPPQWFLRWPLEKGAVWTHLREEDGEGMASTTVDAVSVVEDPATGLPFLLPQAPLRNASSGRPGYQEMCIFLSRDRATWAITIERPSHVREGQVVAASGSDGQSLLRAGAPNAIEVQVSAQTEEAEARQVLETVAGSLKEV